MKTAFNKLAIILKVLLMAPLVLVLGVGTNESAYTIAGSLRRSFRNAGDPVNGTSGTYAGIADAGDFLIDTTNKHVFVNTNTQASPTWSQLRASGPITTKSASAYLSTGDGPLVLVTTDGIYLYLPTYVGNAGLNFLIKQTASFSAGTVIYTLAAQATSLDGAAKKTCGANYDVLEVVCDGTNWNVVSRIGTWS